MSAATVPGTAEGGDRMSMLTLRPRELFLFTGDQVRCITLSPRRQMIAAGVLALGVVAVAAGSTWSSYTSGIYFSTIAHLVSAERQVSVLGRRNEAASRELADVKARMVAMMQARNEVAGERDGLVKRVAELEARLAALETDQKALLARLGRRTSSPNKIEAAVAMTGLNLNKLLQAASKESDVASTAAGGEGGPFVAYRPEREAKQGVRAASFGNGDSPFERAVSALDPQDERSQSLRWIMTHLPLTAPLEEYRFVSGYGPRIDPIIGRIAMHYGLDLTSEPGSAVVATAPGHVVFAGWHGNYGKLVEIDHGMGIHTRYGHLSSISVEVGSEVAARAPIGIIGSTGRSTGRHVHYEVLVDQRHCDPMKFMKAGQYVLGKN